MAEMRFPVATGNAPLEFDTLPVLKTCHFHYDGLEQRSIAMVYAYARLYVLRGVLRLSLCAFERIPPPPASRMAFALYAGGRALAAAVLAPPRAVDGLALWVMDKTARPPLTGAFGRAADAAVPAERFSGEDEQGWYWGARAELPRAVAGQLGLRLAGGDIFSGALYKYRQGVPAWGSTCAGPPMDASALGAFVVTNHRVAPPDEKERMA
jgi:hypothetical protein